MDERRRRVVVATVVAVLAVVAIAVLLTSQPSRYRPTVIGVVSERADGPAGAYRVTLDGGQVVEVDPRTHQVVDGPPQPEPGQLLLAGITPEAWYATLRPQGTCFWVGGRGTEDGAEIRFPSGITLPKAAGFDRAHYHESEHEFNGAGFCVSVAGEVLAVR